MNIAVMGPSGNLVDFQRMGDAYLKSIDIAMLKAATSAGFPFSTKTMEEIAAGRVPVSRMSRASQRLRAVCQS